MRLDPRIIPDRPTELVLVVSGECLAPADGVLLGVRTLQAVAPLIVKEGADGALHATNDEPRSVVIDLSRVEQVTPAFATAFAENLGLDSCWMKARSVRIVGVESCAGWSALRDALKRLRADEWLELRGVPDPARTNMTRPGRRRRGAA